VLEAPATPSSPNEGDACVDGGSRGDSIDRTHKISGNLRRKIFIVTIHKIQWSHEIESIRYRIKTFPRARRST
jgi:hypothetical protein